MAPNNLKKPSGKLPFGNQKQGMYFIIFAFIVLGIILALNFFNSREDAISYTKFLSQLKSNNVKAVLISGQKVRGEYVTPSQTSPQFITIIPLMDDALLPLLKSNEVEIKGQEPRDNGSGMMWLLLLLPVGVIFIWMMVMRGGQGGNPGQGMQFGKSKARLHKDMGKKVNFGDVAGCVEAKQDLAEIVEFLKNPQKFTALGAKIPKGVLLMGSPGTGKTLLAKAVAGEASVPFFSVSGSEFVEMFVGVGASRVRDLFAQGRKNSPCIIFIDELDAVGRSRGTGLGGSHDEREQTLNQILVEMDGFDSSEGLIIVAATNRPDVLDPALLRPGRFDRSIVVDKPDVTAREQILQVHTRKIPLADDIKLETIARATPGLTGADLQNLVNEAALKAGRENRKKVDQADMEFAREKVQMGPERRSKVILEEDKLITAYHESGHAVLSHILPLTNPVHKVTIIPRGWANGYMMNLPQDERSHYFKDKLKQDLIVTLGGRAAEELKFGKGWITSGASQDIKVVTELVTSMVCDWGMSEKLGPVKYSESDGPVFLGKDMLTRKNFSEKIHEEIDMEVSSIITEAFTEAKKLLTKNMDKLEKLATALIEKETLDGDDIDKIIGKSEKNRYPIMKALAKPVKKSTTSKK